MIFLKKRAITMAKYHKWVYERLFESLTQLDPEDYKADYELFFKSIHGTLNHLCLVDKLWYGRFTHQPFQVTGLDQELYRIQYELAEAILKQADDWINFIEKAPLEKFSTLLSYTNTKGISSTAAFSGTLDHVFNHGTHHRGQISAIISRLNKQAPEMDLFFFNILDSNPRGFTKSGT